MSSLPTPAYDAEAATVASALEARGYRRYGPPYGSTATAIWQRMTCEADGRRSTLTIYEYGPLGAASAIGWHYEVDATFVRDTGDGTWAKVRIYAYTGDALLARLPRLEALIAHVRTMLRDAAEVAHG